MSSRVRAFAILLSVAAPVCAADRLHAGLWEFTMTTDGSARTFQHCVTVKEAASANGDTRSARASAEKESAGRCTVLDYKVAGETVSYALQCGTRTIRSTATYHGDTSEGDLVSKNGSEPEAVSHVRAKRLGDCP